LLHFFSSSLAANEPKKHQKQQHAADKADLRPRNTYKKGRPRAAARGGGEAGLGRRLPLRRRRRPQAALLDEATGGGKSLRAAEEGGGACGRARRGRGGGGGRGGRPRTGARTGCGEADEVEAEATRGLDREGE